MSTGQREQSTSAFSMILERLVEATPNAIGAAFADEEGEAVDFYGKVDPFELKIAAAHLGILLTRLEELSSRHRLGPVVELHLAAETGQYITRPVGLGYQVTVVLEPVASLPKLRRAFEQALAEIRLEAGGVLV